MTDLFMSVPVLVESLENRMMLSAATVTKAAHHPPVHHPHNHAVHHTKAPKKTSNASNGDPIFMQYEGIEGDVTTRGFVKDIEVLSFQFGVGRDIASPSEDGASREASAPNISEITITKALDKASPKLLQEAFDGTTKDVTIFLVNIERGKATAYAKYVLSDVLISGYSVHSNGDRPTESLSLNFSKIEFTSFEKGSNGTTTQVKAAWDLATDTNPLFNA